MIMTRRKVLLAGMFLVMFLGGTLLVTPFLVSLSPSARAGEDLPHVDVTNLEIGHYLFFDLNDQWWERYSTRYLIIRLSEDDYKIYFMARNEHGETMLPDMHWWMPYWPCKNFSPSTEQGVVNLESDIACRDGAESYMPNLSWTVLGRPIEHQFDPMEQIDKFTISGGFLIIGKG